MAIAYGLVTSKGNMGRVYDVNLASGDSTGTLTFSSEGDMEYVPDFALIVPMDVTLSAAQVAAVTGGGSAAAYANGTGTVTDKVKVTALTATSVAFASAATVAKSFRCVVGRLYSAHN